MKSEVHQTFSRFTNLFRGQIHFYLYIIINFFVLLLIYYLEAVTHTGKAVKNLNTLF